MSYSNPAAPPPAYDDLFNNQSENTDVTVTTDQSKRHVPLDLSTLHLPAQTLLQPEPPQQTQPESQIVVIQDGPLILGPYPTRIECPHCHKSTLTRIEYRNSCTTHVMVTMLFLIGCFCLAPIPYYVDNCKNAAHYCRKCSNYIGTDFTGGFFAHR